MICSICVLTVVFYQVPYELVNKKFRSVQKVLDREITSATTDLSSILGHPVATVQEVDELLEGMSQRLSSLKRKADECVKEEIDCVQSCKARLDHLKAYASGKCHGLHTHTCTHTHTHTHVQ